MEDTIPSPDSDDQVDSNLTAIPNEDTGAIPESTSTGNDNSISWTASEFIAHEKSAGWFLSLGLATLLLSTVVYVVTRDLVSVIVVIVAAILLGYYATHKPRELEYRLDEQSFSIGSKSFSYDEFRSFYLVPEGAFSSIVLMPLKRFAVPLTMHYPPEDEERIVQLLSQRLPLEESQHDHIDNLMRKIRF